MALTTKHQQYRLIPLYFDLHKNKTKVLLPSSISYELLWIFIIYQNATLTADKTFLININRIEFCS